MGFIRKIFMYIGRLFRWKKSREDAEAEAEAAATGPEPVRIALLGHTATGKTVFYAMLYDQLRKSPEMLMSATSAPTAEYLHKTINLLRGMEDAEDEYGKRVTRRVEPRFPPGTIEGGSLTFTLKPQGENPIHLEMKEYAGEAISLHSIDALAPEDREFFMKAECVFFLLDATMLDAEVEMEARIESLNILLNTITGNRDRAGIPLAFVVSKADTLPGFEHEEQAPLIPSSIPVTRRTDYDKLRAAILDSEIVNREPVWKEQVQRVLDATARLIRVVLHHADRFQIFFTSSIGKPEKVLDEFGVAREKPPTAIKSLGLIEPFRWWTRINKMQRRERAARRFAKVAGVLSFLFLLFGVLWHYPFHHSKFKQVVANWERDPCEAQLVYKNALWTESLHGNLYGAMNFGIFERPHFADDLVCKSPPKPCGEFAREKLDVFSCTAENLSSCDDVRSLCVEPVRDLKERLRAQFTAAAAGESVEGVSEEVSQYSQCWRDVEPAMTARIQTIASRLDLGRDYARLVRGLNRLDGGQAGDYEDLQRVYGTATSLIACAAGKGGASDEEFLASLIQPEAARVVMSLVEVLGPGEDGTGGLSSDCEPVSLLRLGNRVGTDVVPAGGSSMRDGLEGLRNRLFARSYYCLDNTSCRNMASAPEKAVTACKTAIDAYLKANPPGELMSRAQRLDDRANRRLSALGRQAAAPQGQVAQATPGAGPGGGGPGGPGTSGGGSSGGGSGPGGAAGSGGTPTASQAAQVQKARTTWKGIRVTFQGFETGDDMFDFVPYRYSASESWDTGSLWEDVLNQTCVNKDQSFELAVSRDEGGDTVNAQFPKGYSWTQLTGMLAENGKPGEGGGPASAEIQIEFDPDGMVVGGFRLEGYPDGCP